MAENIYRFEFVDGTENNEQNGITDILGSGTKESSGKQKKDKTFSESFTKKASDNAIQQTLISPLNTVTGGLASPLYRTGKMLARGTATSATIGSIGAMLAIFAIQKGIEHVQNRMKELETKVERLNNTDNALIRAGSVSKVTYYSANIFGIKQTTNRS